MIETLHDFTTSLPPLLQWLGIIVASAIPFVESYLGAFIGVIAGVYLPVAVGAAIAGNVVSMFGFVHTADKVRSRVVAGRHTDAGTPPDEAASPRRRRLRRAFDRYGVAGVSLFGQTILPSQITAAALVSFGARRNAVIVWQTISISLWGIAFGALAALGVDLATV